MEPLILSDESVFPSDDLIFSIIGDNSVYWKNLLASVRQKFPSAEEIWKFYKDGNNWLFRVILKKKTLFWIGVHEDTFRVTFYFGDKAEPAIEMSGLTDEMKAAFKNGQRYGKIRALSFKVKNMEDVNHALVVAGIKAGM